MSDWLSVAFFSLRELRPRQANSLPGQDLLLAQAKRHEGDLWLSDKVIQAILRHSNVNVTLGYYIKPQSSDVIAAMQKFEAEMAAQSLRDINGTPNLPSGAMPKSVN